MIDGMNRLCVSCGAKKFGRLRKPLLVGFLRKRKIFMICLAFTANPSINFSYVSAIFVSFFIMIHN
jgi:hypothetical protein